MPVCGRSINTQTSNFAVSCQIHTSIDIKRRYTYIGTTHILLQYNIVSYYRKIITSYLVHYITIKKKLRSKFEPMVASIHNLYFVN